jgi:hypothetical protein
MRRLVIDWLINCRRGPFQVTVWSIKWSLIFRSLATTIIQSPWVFRSNHIRTCSFILNWLISTCWWIITILSFVLTSWIFISGYAIKSSSLELFNSLNRNTQLFLQLIHSSSLFLYIFLCFLQLLSCLF